MKFPFPHRAAGQRGLRLRQLAAAALCSIAATSLCFAAATIDAKIDPPEVNVGDPVIVTLTVQNGSLNQVQLPKVDGLQVTGMKVQLQSMNDNGVYSTSEVFNLSIATFRSGDFTIPAFDLRAQSGEMLHVRAMKVHVLALGVTPTNSAAATSPPDQAAASIPSASVTPNTQGPVVMPPPGDNADVAPNADPNGNYGSSADADDSGISVPRDKDGNPAKVFIIIQPETTEGYIGQSIPMRIDFYIRSDVNTDQNSLPTIDGSDFLMNSFLNRGRESLRVINDEQYECETWFTAISAPKSGNFPLQMERDSYWVKSNSNSGIDPFSGFFNRQESLAHEQIASNQLTIHIQPLPDQGRPPSFSGAIGQFKITGSAEPDSVAVGEPVTLHFAIGGEGNFDYVRSPALGTDPSWKPYTPSSKTNYLDESRTRAVKVFDQAVIPQKNGNLQLPSATFSYFDPATKQYVTVPIALPEINVTGSAAPIAAAPVSKGADASVAAPSAAAGFRPNRVQFGSAQRSLVPAYRQSWFWAVQAGLLCLPFLGALVLYLRFHFRPDDAHAERAQRQRSLRQEEDAMTDAVRRSDAVAFFIAARHAVQLQLGAQWKRTPESLTLGEIRQHDASLAELLQPLFAQADEAIYSGHASPNIDLAQWEQRVRTELLQLQPA
jgi:hypothetical protein